MPAAALTEPHPRPSRGLTAATDLRSVLRNATAEAHARLDEIFGAFDLRRLPDYRRFLEAHAAAVLPLEAALDKSEVGQIFPDWPQRARAHAIVADIDMLGGTVGALPDLPILDFASVLGTMYVLEGSRLGAGLLLLKVRQSPDPLVAQTTAYLGHGTGSHLWQSFLAMLERHARRLSDSSKAIAAARSAFGLFEQAATDCAHRATALR